MNETLYMDSESGKAVSLYRGVLRLIVFASVGLASLVGSRMHDAEFAKKCSGLYGVLCRHVAGNAVRYARRNGYEAVTCGHTHHLEERMICGTRYLNTGCWTEANSAAVVVDEHPIQLCAISCVVDGMRSFPSNQGGGAI